MGESITPPITNMPTTVNPWILQKIVPQSAIFVIPQDATFYPENTAEEADLSKVEEQTWKNIGAIKTVTYNQETEDDESVFFDAISLQRVKEKNTQITLRTWEIEVERYTLFYEALLHGAKDLLSEETIAKMASGSEGGLPIFQSNDPNVPVGVKMAIYDLSQHKLLTRYFYAYLKASGELTHDTTKILRPKLTLEQQASKWSILKTEKIFTKETESE